MPPQQWGTASPKHDTTGSQEREKVTTTVLKLVLQRKSSRSMKNKAGCGSACF